MTFISDIGFYDKSGYERAVTMQQMKEHGEIIRAGDASYIKWSPNEGVELWAKFTEGKIDLNLHPYFFGKSRMRVALIEKMLRSNQVISEGAFLCRNKPCMSRDWIAGGLPFVFDAPDYDLYNGLQLPKLAEVQLTAFAFQATGYEDEDEYWEANPTDEDGYGFEPEHFIPTTYTMPRGENNELQPPCAEISGTVLDTAIITNEATGRDFCWAKLRTVGGEVDMVCAPTSLEGYLVTGGIAMTNSYLTGRLIKDTSN